MTRAWLSLALALLAVITAEAQGAKPPSPEGEWTFVSGPMPGGCVFSGDMAIRKSGAEKFSCSFSGRWACPAGLPSRTDTRQSCTATQKGVDIAISSKLDKVISTMPASMMDDMRTSYLADQFSVRINPNADEMDGRSFDAINHAKVKFRRKQDLVS